MRALRLSTHTARTTAAAVNPCGDAATVTELAHDSARPIRDVF
jgi:hypothetical protein